MDVWEESIKAVNDQFFTGADGITINEDVTKTERVTPTSVDLLQQARNARRDETSRGSRGAKPRMAIDLSMLNNDTLRTAYKKAKDDSDYYTKIGNPQYAGMIKQQYMEDYFLPAIDAMVKLNGMGAVQSNPDILRQLDSLTLLDGTSGKGYTEYFIRSLYASEGEVERSDAQVKQAVKEIKALCETDQIATAVGRANDIKKRIEAGENIANDDDYTVIQRVALYGEN